MLPYLSVEVRDLTGKEIIPLDHEWAEKIASGVNLIDDFGVIHAKAGRVVLTRENEAERKLQVTPASVFTLRLVEFAAEMGEDTEVNGSNKNRLAWALNLFIHKIWVEKNSYLFKQTTENQKNLQLMSEILNLHGAIKDKSTFELYDIVKFIRITKSMKIEGVGSILWGGFNQLLLSAIKFPDQLLFEESYRCALSNEIPTYVYVKNSDTDHQQEIYDYHFYKRSFLFTTKIEGESALGPKIKATYRDPYRRDNFTPSNLIIDDTRTKNLELCVLKAEVVYIWFDQYGDEQLVQAYNKYLSQIKDPNITLAQFSVYLSVEMFQMICKTEQAKQEKYEFYLRAIFRHGKLDQIDYFLNHEKIQQSNMNVFTPDPQNDENITTLLQSKREIHAENLDSYQICYDKCVEFSKRTHINNPSDAPIQTNNHGVNANSDSSNNYGFILRLLTCQVRGLTARKAYAILLLAGIGLVAATYLPFLSTSVLLLKILGSMGIIMTGIGVAGFFYHNCLFRPSSNDVDNTNQNVPERIFQPR